jgi:putative intracellular protease/amidase
MPSVLMAVTGSDVWTFADGERHPCGYWPEELVAPHRVFTAAGLDVTIATPGGVAPTADEAGFTPEMNNGSTEAGPEMRAYHGPAALLPARSDDGSWLFSGYQVTGFTNTEEGQVGYAGRAAWLLEDRLRAGGGKFENADPWQARVVVDRNLYTGQNPASSGPLAERLVAAVHASTA